MSLAVWVFFVISLNNNELLNIYKETFGASGDTDTVQDISFFLNKSVALRFNFLQRRLALYALLIVLMG